MSDRVRKCLVIAAGRGSRLASGGLPKPLFRLLGLPLVERILVTAQRAGLDEFAVVTGYDSARVTEFLDQLALRRGITIAHVVNEKWRGGNALSVLAAREAIGDEPFALLMADHVVDVPLLSELLNEPLEAGGVCLAVDRNLSNPLVDLDDVTKVRAADGRLEAIGKDGAACASSVRARGCHDSMIVPMGGPRRSRAPDPGGSQRTPERHQSDRTAAHRRGGDRREAQEEEGCHWRGRYDVALAGTAGCEAGGDIRSPLPAALDGGKSGLAS